MNALACFMEEVRLDDRVCLGSRHMMFLLCVGDTREEIKEGGKGREKEGREGKKDKMPGCLPCLVHVRCKPCVVPCFLVQ